MPITARLRDGSSLEIEIAEPPFDSSYDSFRLCWWPMIVDDLLQGRMNRWLYAPHFIGRIDGDPAGSMCYYAPRDSGAVGAVEFVGTSERFRRRGVASALLGTLVDHFTARGGQALYLCTDNPVAGHLYERHGFRYHVGDGMRYLAPDAANFDRRWFAPGGAATIRDAHWGDLARLCVLYNHPDPPWLVKDPLSAAFRDTRYERHFVSVLRQIEDARGAFLVLEAAGARVVGAAAFRRLDTFHEQHVATLSLRVARGYFGLAADLLETAAVRAATLGIRQLALPLATEDDEPRRLAEAAGFAAGPRWPRRLRDGEGRFVDLTYMLRELPPSASHDRPRESFYGERHPWQAARAASAEDGGGAGPAAAAAASQPAQSSVRRRPRGAGLGKRAAR